jgi:hypothetical protein
VIRKVYGERSDTLVSKVQGVSCPDPARNSCQYVSRMANTCELVEIREIRSLLQ